MDYNPYSNYVDLLDSQRENVISLDSPPAPVFRREGTQDSSFGDSPPQLNKTGEADEGTVRPPGVKAAKRLGKKTMKEEKGLSEFKEIWSIKEEDMTRKERIVKMGLLDRLLAKPEPLPEYEESLKKKLISELF
ncbi:hypothetical protein YC2023_050086 [Brassica napus]